MTLLQGLRRAEQQSHGNGFCLAITRYVSHVVNGHVTVTNEAEELTSRGSYAQVGPSPAGSDGCGDQG